MLQSRYDTGGTPLLGKDWHRVPVLKGESGGSKSPRSVVEGFFSARSTGFCPFSLLMFYYAPYLPEVVLLSSAFGVWRC